MKPRTLGPQERFLCDWLRGHISGDRQHQHADHECAKSERCGSACPTSFFLLPIPIGKLSPVDHHLARFACGQGISPLFS